MATRQWRHDFHAFHFSGSDEARLVHGKGNGDAGVGSAIRTIADVAFGEGVNSHGVAPWGRAVRRRCRRWAVVAVAAGNQGPSNDASCKQSETVTPCAAWRGSGKHHSNQREESGEINRSPDS